LKLLNFAPWAR